MNIAPTKYAGSVKTHQFCAKKHVLTIFRSTSKHVPNYPKHSHSRTNAVSTGPISKNFPTAPPTCQMGNQQQDQQQYPYQKQQQETAGHINFFFPSEAHVAQPKLGSPESKSVFAEAKWPFTK